MGIGPVPATRIALEKAGLKLHEIDLVEVNEAFAASTLLLRKNLDWIERART
jgi:Acetyl-CoA acetyltransferase